MADVITCHSGLTGRVRGMKVREERVLADRSDIRYEKPIEKGPDVTINY